ncbi:MAG: serine/threonine protein kinase, partial [Deltaproteobacteria bacterium]|nr:serine/threonine protein kinase [Deltaproteobacteria bacterium]
MGNAHNSNDLRQFGRYTIDQPLGSGGMATVYAASIRGPGGAARPVALKLIHPHLAQEQGFVRMFVEETRMAMAFQHRNIVQTFDAGEVQGRHFMAMERVDGYTLRDLITRLKGRPFPVDLALFVCKEVAAGLDYAHSFAPELTGQPGAVIHRDVSPSNILLSKAGDVKLADFGVARAAQGEHSTSNLVKGKITYMAPEQARGRACPVSDVFSLAAVLYELLTKEPLRRVTSLEDALNLPVPKSIHERRKDVPASVDALLKRTLHKDAGERPTARQLRDALAKELHLLQHKAEPKDPHDTLATLIKGLPAPPPDPRAEGMAHAMLEEARRLETLSRGSGASSEGTPPTGVTIPNSHRSPPRVGEPPRSWRHAWTMLGLLGLAGVVIIAALALPKRGCPFQQESSGLVQPLDAGAKRDTRDTRDTKKDTALSADVSVVDAKISPPDTSHRAKRQTSKRRRPKPKERRPKAAKRADALGTLHLNAVPWAHVTIDGKKRGTTPLEGIMIPVGRHRITLENPEQGLKRS